MIALPDCVPEIAAYYDVPPAIIAAVQKVESSTRGQDVGKVGPNRNGTYDLGAMQINTWWLDKVNQWGIDEQELLENECTNFAVGTWILHQNLVQYGDLKAALSAYNTGRPDSESGLQYANRVFRLLE